MSKLPLPGPPLCALLLLCGVTSAARAAAQEPTPPPGVTKEDDDVLKAGPKDPFTDGDPKLMAAAGVVRYGPFPWGDHVSTADIDHVLGTGRILWLETEHFRIGCSLRKVALPQDQDKRRYLYDELKRLKKRLPKVDDHPKNLDPWLRLHLFAQRAEEQYADFTKRMGLGAAEFPGGAAPNGKYLGLPDKFLLLLLQKKADLARYLDRFCGVQGDRSYRICLKQTNQMLAAAAVEGMEGMDDQGLQGHVAYSLAHNFLDGYRGFTFELPLWFAEGFAHWYARKVPTDFINVTVKDDEAVDQEKQHQWPQKVRRRVQHDGTWLHATQLFALQQPAALGYQDHMMSWSRVDYLMATGEDKVGLFLQQLKHLPPPPDGGTVSTEQVQQLAQKLLQQLFALDADTFDTRWREWVLKTYVKK